MPTTTSGGSSNAWEQPRDEPPEAAAPTGWVGEHGPELVELPATDAVLPEGWTADPGPGAESSADAPEVLSAADVAAGYTDLSFAQLRAEAKARGLPAGGSAVDLAARLGEHDAASAPAADDDGGAPVVADGG